MKARMVVLLALAAALVAGCTTIPSSSAPDVVRSIPKTSPSATSVDLKPSPGAAPADIINGFLQAAVDADAGHSIARQFLSTAEARKWQDDPTIVLDQISVSLPSFQNNQATMSLSGKRVGTVDASGAYTPTLKNAGLGDTETFSFTMVRVSGQWRIDQLPSGVLIRQADFLEDYKPRKIYFFDSNESILVPDLRYSPLSGQSLCTWLLQRILGGPRPELTQSVINEVPDQANGKATVEFGDPIAVDLPGTLALQTPDRNALATQLAFTFGQVAFSSVELRLTDSGRLVRIPAANGPTFTASDFSGASPDALNNGTSYYVHDGAIYTGAEADALTKTAGRPLDLGVTSIAMRSSSQALKVAAIKETGQLALGTPSGVTVVPLRYGPTSRPEWSPQNDEVWVGVNQSDTVYRVGSGQTPTSVPLSSQVGQLPTGLVTALRFSPDGARIALVLRSPDGQGTVWVGAMVTSGSTVRIDSLEPVTPPALSVVDLAWSDPTRLLLILNQPGSSAAGVWSVLCDGSQLDVLRAAGLPASPTSIAAASAQHPIVSAGGQMYELIGTAWRGLAGKPSVPGINPVYGL